MSESEELKVLIRTRGNIKGIITRIISFLKEDTSASIDEVEVRKLKLEEAYENFLKIQVQIEILSAKEKLEVDHESYKGQFEDHYFECATLISRRLRELNQLPPTSTSSRCSTSSHLSPPVTIKQTSNLLPQIEIRPFDGNPINWYSFHDSFKNLVHDNDELIPVHKFYLLQNALQGPLKSITENLNASEENYKVAWDSLKQRCNKPRQIIQTHLNSLFEIPGITKESPVNLRTLIEKAQVHINALKALKQPIEHWDTLLVFIIVKKLDNGTRRAWERTLENEDMPTFNQLIKFLTKQARGDEMDNNFAKKSNNTHGQSYVNTQAKSQCSICNLNHVIYSCPRFLKLNEKERFENAKNAKLCLNCLRNNHTTKKCLVNEGCKKCNRRHHTLLHFVNSNKSHNQNSNENVQNQTHSTQTLNTQIPKSQNLVESNQIAQSPVSLTAIGHSEILLGTACIKILDKHQNEIPCRVLLDSGSQTHFITEDLAERLKLNKTKINISFSGLGQQTANSRYTVKTTIKSRTTTFSKELTLVALPIIAGLLPVKSIQKSQLLIPKNLPLADPNFNKSARIDALIGSEIFYQLLSIGQIKLSNNLVILQKTQLGWIVTGKVNIPNDHSTKSNSCFLSLSLENQLQKFWEIEEIHNKKHLSKEESACETHFTKTINRDSNGRYQVRLPFNNKKEVIVDSYKTALKRFYSLEKKFETNLELKEQYSEFLREYQNLNHMTDITTIDNKQEGYYLPHHAVFKESSITTKIRVVFDASAKSTTNISLNDTLMQGPVIQDDLVSIILRSREYDFVIAADIEKMFRQFLVPPQDAVFQKILWRNNTNEAIKTFMLNTITYGTKSASYQATRCLKQLSLDYAKEFPLAALVLERDFYVDDLLTGSNDLKQAKLLVQQLIQLLKLGQLNLRQWVSNESSLLKNIKESTSSKIVCLEPSDSKKILGIRWDPNTDLINYSVKSFNNDKKVTKRNILSEISQLFDPLGLLGPVVIKAKLIMQDLWKANLNWDESIPQALHTEWVNLKSQLHLLNNFSVNRKVLIKNAENIQLHGFCDASEKGYGACIYLRSTDNSNKHLVNLVCAKSRVAPIKTISLPRLELCAAKLLANLFLSYTNASNLKFDRINFYTDSTITLNWINKSPHTLKTFEANRVSEIQKLTKKDDWYHVSSADNPADYISRGQTPLELIKNQTWLNGPHWLSQNEINWRNARLPLINNTEAFSISLHASSDKDTNLKAKINSQIELFEKFSDIKRLNRFVALCHRLVLNTNPDNKIKGELTASEISDAHLKIIKIIQENEFAQEFQALKQGKELSNKSSLLKLNPFVDEFGILRVGGRLRNAQVSFQKRYPILLPRNSHITKLIIRNEHEKHWHTGIQNTLNYVRENYWPIDGKNRVRFILRKCIKCFKVNPKLPDYLMGDLPKNRLIQTRPFENTGLDYCGPFHIKEKKFRNTNKIKSYVVVFICFSTKAIHLELVTDLTTESCLAAIKRFFCRRGKSKNLYSDNGTNFVGAKNEIIKLKALLLSNDHNNKLAHDLANEGVNWHFTPPRAPHFGGLWEAGVKQFKAHLYRTVGEALFTYEQFNTFIIEIESVLNSRPLTPLSSDPNDFLALTPAHLLIGDSLTNVPEADLQEIPTNRLSLWQHITKVKQHFWKKWHRDYLNQLLLRSKWNNPHCEQIKVGTLVTLKEDNSPPMHWPLGRIVAVHPGKDDIVRVATVKTSSGTYKRCIKKLCPLPIDLSETN